MLRAYRLSVLHSSRNMKLVMRPIWSAIGCGHGGTGGGDGGGDTDGSAYSQVKERLMVGLDV